MLPPIYRHMTSIAAFLSALLAFQACGWVVAWSVARQEARRIARSALHCPASNPMTVTLATAEWHRMRIDDQEIRLQGRLFDTQVLHTRGDSVVLSLSSDEKEAQLITALEAVIAPVLRWNHPMSAPAEPFVWHLLQWLDAPFLPVQSSLLPSTPRPWGCVFFHYCNLSSSAETRRPDPPPERFFLQPAILPTA